MENKRNNICLCEKVKKYFVDYKNACPLHGSIKSMEEVIKSECSLLSGYEVIVKERIDIVVQVLKNAGYIHKSEIIK